MSTFKGIIAGAALLLGGAAGCGGQQGAEPASAPQQKQVAASSNNPGLRTGPEVTKALEQAQAAYLDGHWGDAVLKATAVVEGAASPDDYYLAVKILGMASCSRKDPRPVTFAWKRLQPADRDSLKNACEQNGMTISSAGIVTVGP
jgi:hypothetical protein